MKFETALERVKGYPIPPNWGGSMFLLPEAVMADLYQCVLSAGRKACLELGSGFGATSCILAAAMEETGGRVVTVDIWRHRPVGVDLVAEHAGLGKYIDVVVEPLGYNWWLADRLKDQTPPVFDFCLLDGAHEFEPDALAFTLASRLLEPGADLVLDDINFKLRDVPNWKEAFGTKSDRELDTYQLQMVYDLVIRHHPEFRDFRITHDGRIGWARKRKRWFTRG